LTFHVKNGLEDEAYYQFLKYWQKKNKEINQMKEKKKEKTN
jgi:hypothetical protein